MFVYPLSTHGSSRPCTRPRLSSQDRPQRPIRFPNIRCQPRWNSAEQGHQPRGVVVVLGGSVRSLSSLFFVSNFLTLFKQHYTRTSWHSRVLQPVSPSGQSKVFFNPLHARLAPRDSALFPLNKVVAYIDDVLLALGLHAEARTSFITSVTRIALSFLSNIVT